MKKSIPLSAIKLHTADGKEYDIPERGSLALLALGDIGVMAWRQKIQTLRQVRIQEVLDHRKQRDQG